MYQKFLKTCKWFRKLVCNLFGLKNVGVLDVPTSIYSDFKVNYLVYDQNGAVLFGTKTLREALQKRNRKDKVGLGITVIYNKY